MDRHLSWVVASVLLAVLAGTGGVYAEVSSAIDRDGNFVRMIVFANASDKKPKIWTVQRARDDRRPLNPEGDGLGDLWPLILENRYDNNHPLVVWSRSNGDELALVWSRWADNSWTEIWWVEAEKTTPGDGNRSETPPPAGEMDT